MHEICHRCGGELPSAQIETSNGGSHFCPHCGAPQLMLSEYAEPLSTSEEDPRAKQVSTGTLPPPRPNQIDWRLAIQSAALVAAVAAILGVAGSQFPKLSIFSFIWVISASLTTLALYQRRRPLASMNIRIGLKIGILVGVMLAFALGASSSVGTLVARFSLHSMAESDRQTAQVLAGMKLQLDQAAAARPVPPEFYAALRSAEAPSVVTLVGLGMAMIIVVSVSIFGGAMAGLLRTRRNTVA